jgi:hypothetical protein
MSSLSPLSTLVIIDLTVLAVVKYHEIDGVLVVTLVSVNAS